MKIIQELDLNLYYLWSNLQCLSRQDYSIEIKKKIYELSMLIESILYKKFPKGYDLIKEQCMLTLYFEKSQLPKN